MWTGSWWRVQGLRVTAFAFPCMQTLGFEFTVLDEGLSSFSDNTVSFDGLYTIFMVILPP